jgi:hypothetical protein
VFGGGRTSDQGVHSTDLRVGGWDIFGDVRGNPLLATNPFGFESYAAELTALSADLEELTPRDPELDSAIKGLAVEISGLLGALEESPPALDRVPGHVAEAQLVFRDVTTLCGLR